MLSKLIRILYRFFSSQQPMLGNLTSPPYHSSRFVMGFNWASAPPYLEELHLYHMPLSIKVRGRDFLLYTNDQSNVNFNVLIGSQTPCVTCNYFSHKLYCSEMVLHLFIKRTEVQIVLIFINRNFQ